MARSKKSDTPAETPATDAKAAQKAAQQEAVAKYREAHSAVTEAEEALAKAKAAESVTVEGLHAQFGSEWMQLDGRLVQARKNRYGFHLIEFQERSRPEPKVVI